MELFWIAETDSERRLFGRRYLSGETLVVAEGAGGASPSPGPEVVIFSWGVLATVTESSLDPAFWLRADRSEEDEDEVVEIEGLEG